MKNKNKFKSFKYKESDAEEVRALCQKGLSDIEISKITKCHVSFCQRISTMYWKDKMEQKNNKKNEVK